MSKKLTTTSGQGQFLVYSAEDGEVRIDVRLENETVWLTRLSQLNPKLRKI